MALAVFCIYAVDFAINGGMWVSSLEDVWKLCC